MSSFAGLEHAVDLVFGSLGSVGEDLRGLIGVDVTFLDGSVHPLFDGSDERVHEIVSALNSGPFIFNLGHGIQPETPIAHVERLVHLVKTGEA